MLSSLVSTLSPKKLLAASISNALAEFFDVDPEQVETNLVQNAKVTLKGIEIKQRRQGGLLVCGSVGQIEFSWAWDTGSFITDAKLTVKGVDVHMRLLKDNEQFENSSGVNSSTEPLESSNQATSNAGNGKDSDWKARYKQQIIDHLTLLIADVSISIQLMDESRVIVEAKDMELQTVHQVGDGKDESSALMQEICLGSIAAWIQDADDTQYPILSPFGYHASVQRISGRRFLDGVLSGLIVQGKPWTNVDDTHAVSAIRVHAGKHQLIGLNCLQRVLQNVGNDADASPGEEKDSTKQDALEQVPERSLPSSTASSIFRLPLQSIEIVLEDDLKVGLAGCEIRYCMDGTELALHCNGGLWMNGSPISKNGCVVVDFANFKLELDTHSSQEDKEVFYKAQSKMSPPSDTEGELIQMHNEKDKVEFKFSIDHFQRLYCSISVILPECQQAVALVEQTKDSKLQVRPDLSTSTSWTIVAKDSSSFRFEGNDNAWIQVTASGLKIQQRYDTFSGFPFTFTCRSAQLESFNGLAITVPSIETNDKNISVSDRVSASFESINSLVSLKEIWEDVSSIVGSQPATGAGLNFTVPGVDISCSEANFGNVALDELSGSGSIVTLESLRMEDVKGLSMEARHLELSVENGEKSLQIKEVLTCDFDSNPILSLPVQNLEFKHHQHSLSIACDDLAIFVPYQQHDDKPKTTKTTEAPELDMNPLERYVKTLHLQAKKLSFSTDAGDALRTQNISFSIALGSQSHFDIAVGRVSVQTVDKGEITCRDIKSSGNIDNPTRWSTYLLRVPVWKRFSSTNLAIESIDSLMLPDFGHLHAPIENMTMVFDNDLATVRCKSVKFSPKLTPMGHRGSQPHSMAVDLPSLKFGVQRLVLMPEFGGGKPGLCFDQLNLLCRPQDSGLLFNIHCNYLQGRGPTSIDFAIKKVAISAVKAVKGDSTGKTDFFGFRQAEVAVDEISSLSVPGHFRLAKPTSTFTAKYKNGEVESTFVDLHLICEYVRNSQISNPPVGGLEVTTNIPSIRVLVQKGDIEWLPVEASGGSQTRISFENSTIRLSQDESENCIHFSIGIDSIHGKKEDGSAMIASRGEFAALMQPLSNEGAVLETFSIPLLGSLESAKVSFSEIEAFHVPNVISLESPSRNIEAQYSNNGLVFTVQELSLQRFVEDSINPKKEQPTSFDLPCKINISIVTLCIEDIVQPKATGFTLRCNNLSVGLEPSLAKIGLGRESIGAGAFFRCQSLVVRNSSAIVNVPELSGSGLLQYSIPDTIGNLVIELEKAQLEANFSSMEWSGAGKRQRLNMKLPFAAVPKFILTLNCTGTLLSVEDAIIACEAFEGTSETTLDVLKAHYVGIVQDRIPHILAAKTSIAGANIGDSVGMMAGSIITHTSVIGATVGVASRDAVGSAVLQGKAARGADESEKYQFGDFTRGVISSVQGAAKSGAAMRNDEQYHFGDFTAGTTKAASSYASKNRMRLAGAGGSAVGMIAGAAVLGPIGFVAGSFLGSSAAQTSVRSIVGDHSEDKKTKIGESSSADGSNIAHQPLDHQRDSSCLPASPVALNADARMVGDVATCEQIVVMAQAQVVDLLSSEPPVAPITSPTNGVTQRYTQATVSAPTANAAPLGRTANGNASECASYSGVDMPTPMHYPVATATPVAAPTNTMLRARVATASYGNQNRYNAGHQQLNAARAQSRNIQANSVGRRPAAPSPSNNSAESQQQQGYRFGDVTRGIVARGRQLDGREENSGYQFGDFTRGLFGS